jgi:DNA-directed RNA polymerase specialized sigma24 family protein
VTTFAAALQICDLSQSQAAEFFGVRLDTVKSWCSQRRPTLVGVRQTLADLYHRIRA